MVGEIIFSVFCMIGVLFLLYALVETQRDLNHAKKSEHHRHAA
jgi:hypothetical protein